MCIITLIPANEAVPAENIKKGAYANPDGHGWVVASAAYGIVMGKSMESERAIKDFLAERARQGDGSVALFHSRIGTHGSRTLANVHPFYVPDKVVGGGEGFSTVMAHNGVLPSVWHPDRGDDRSDTRVFADRLATHYITERGVPSRRGARILGDMIGTGNKLVFVSIRMPGRPMVRIVNASSGTWDSNVWYSNQSYKRPRYVTHVQTPGKVCTEKGCKTTFYGYHPEKKCYQHRSKSTPVTTGSTRPHFVSPYAAPKPRWGGLGTPPTDPKADEISEEAQDLLDDIERTLVADFEGTIKAEDIDSDRKCDVCRTKGRVHAKTNICLNCQYCLDCWVEMRSCTCFDYQGWWLRQIADAEALAEALAEDDNEPPALTGPVGETSP